VSEIDTSLLLAQELVHFGFINEVIIESVFLQNINQWGASNISPGERLDCILSAEKHVTA
jgi:hypothetical protein